MTKLWLAHVFLAACHGCTIVMVGKDASSSGYPMVTHTTDIGSSAVDVRFTRTPRKEWPEGSVRPVYNWGSGYPRMVDGDLSPAYAPIDGQVHSKPMMTIPQVPVTWGYWDTVYGVQNEWGLSMGESTTTAMTVGFPADKPYGLNYISIADLSKIGLERCKTARCAIQTMGDLAVKHGFFSEDSGTIDKPMLQDSAEALGIVDADPAEAWIFNVMTGKGNKSAIWAAQRIPDNHVAGVGNSFTIRKMRLDDPDNFMFSDGVKDLAIEMGWWDPEGNDPNEFDFMTAYGHRATKEHELDVDAFYSGRRMWRIFSLLSPAEGKKLDPATGNLPGVENPYPISVPAPKGSVTLEMVYSVHRDHYEGTDFDLTKGMAAGPFGNPNRGASIPASASQLGVWERAISMHRTAWSYVCVAKPGGMSITWFGFDAPHGTAYLPVYAGDENGPPSFSSSDCRMSKFSKKCAWWVFNAINQYQDLNFQLINKDVLAKAQTVERKAMELVAKLEAIHENVADIAPLSNQFNEEMIAELWEFRDDLHAKFGRYKVTYDESETGMANTYYPEWWINSSDVAYKAFKPAGPNVGGKCLDASSVPTPSTDGFTKGAVIAVAAASAAAASLFVGCIVGCIAYQFGRRAVMKSGARQHLEIGLQP